ncbi:MULTISPECIES: histidine phosphatase family protein [unclassified Arthrobacter]|uniref:histidine phosphatase family protein n=1 Tax=unclassified Arthrobacter TaxID=235627 RepID=UPI002DFFB510|nr:MULTISPECIES: histidine phosphatase family protein [unclassified Arthrobacter]MEC5189903.1 broad specificity phosphatase PhoE [Arthrobacter sp. MP_M4]MEC5201370.1 broad specificity phosphatase PhoE [Arthrobacter sp. MP_M7]
MPQATVHLLRHGEVHNPDGVLYGRLPEFHLSELGQEMARMLAEHFSARSAQGANIVHLAASPLTRAQETAQPIAAALHLEIATEGRIIEAANYFEGLHVDKAELLRPKHWPMLRNPFRPSWGEAYKDQAARVIAAVQDARLRAVELGGDGAEAILVSHQLPIWTTRLSAEGKPLWHDPRKRECTLTSVTSLVFDDAGSLLRVEYSEPAASLLPRASSTPGA